MKKLLLTLCLVVVFSNLFAQNSQDEQLAIQYFQEGEYEKAEDIFSKLYDKKQDTYIYFYYYQTLLNLKNYKEMEKVVKRQIRQQPTVQRFKIDLGYVYEISNEGAQATKTYENAIKEVSANENSILELYNAFLSFGKQDYALMTLQRGRKLLNNDKLFSIQFTSIYTQQNQTGKVIEEALNLVKDNEIQYIGAAEQIIQNLLLDDETKLKYQSVKTELQKQIQKNPNNTCFMQLLYWVAELNRDYPEALLLAKSLDKHEKGEGANVYYLALAASKNRDFQTAIDGFQYVIAKGDKSSYATLAEYALLNTKYDRLLTTFPVRLPDALSLEKEFKKKIEESGIHDGTTDWVRKYAHLLAFFVDKPQEAITLLNQAIQNEKDLRNQAVFKVDLADIQLYTENEWEASLLYSQVEKTLPNDTIGQYAKYCNAKLSFYLGYFAWAKSQLDILKAATNRYISNDAIYLSFLISENEEDEEEEDEEAVDTLLFPEQQSNLALLYYAKADFLIFQNKDDKALTMLDSVTIVSPFSPLHDDVLYLKSNIYIRQGKYLQAEKMLQELLTDYSTDILGDDATYLLAQLYDYHLKDPEKAMIYYQSLMKNYANSIWVTESRNRFRKLRGDNL
ncbi:MAG: tetratricopeptide repeat protein [Bacteroidales bacterium]|nr:tetratricopeptide repeat protein [Bacteroidales bacterium]